MCESSIDKPDDVLKSFNTNQGYLGNKNENLETIEEAVTTDSEEYVTESLRYDTLYYLKNFGLDISI